MTTSHSQAQVEWLHLSATEMARQIAAGHLSSLELTEAHIARIEAVNPKLNAVVVPMFSEARSAAAAVDAARDRGEPLGPLGGVPITIKECFYVAGTAATEGVARYAGEIMADDSPLVARLRRAGAVILGKTNLPQLMLMHETDNPLYGLTCNPWNLERAPGGSSGGEAAIIAAGGSPLGLGNDIGGSIRNPAHACGICGIKPTTRRLTNAGTRDNMRGMEAIVPQPGPLARRVEDLYPALSALNTLVEGEIDPQAVPAPLLNPAEVAVDKLRIGTWTDDGVFAASPAVVRAVEAAAEALASLGAQVEPFAPPDMSLAVRLYFRLLSADGAADARRILGPGPVDWRLRRMILMGRAPRLVRKVLQAMSRLGGQARTAELLDMTGPSSTDGYWQLCRAQAEYAANFFAAWDRAGLDALLCPPSALPALRHGGMAHLPLAGSYGYWANLLGVPAGVVPVTRVRPGEERSRPASRDIVERAAAEVDSGSAGLPVGVQVAGRPWREDVVLAVMQAIELQASSKDDDYPHTPVDVA